MQPASKEIVSSNTSEVSEMALDRRSFIGASAAAVTIVAEPMRVSVKTGQDKQPTGLTEKVDSSYSGGPLRSVQRVTKIR
jgi:hypothetical protein